MRALLIDSNLAALPIYEQLIDYGYEVHIVSSNVNDYLSVVCEYHKVIDYSNINAVAQYIDQVGFECIIPGCNDLSYLVATKLASRYNFIGFNTVDSVHRLHDKKQFRALSHRLGLTAPVSYSLEEAFIKKDPLIIKPVDSFSGKGVSIIHSPNKENISDAVNVAISASIKGDYVIEDFVEGELYSLSAFLVDGKVLIDFVVEEKCTASEFAVDTSRVVVISDHRINKLRSDVEAIANFLSLQNGLLHTQFILNDEGAWIIEPTLRCPGDLYSHLIEKTTGFNYALAYIMPFLSKNYNKLLDGNVKKRHIIRHTLTSKERIILKSISCSGEFLNTEIFPLQISGSTIHEAPSTRIATIFVEFKTVDDMEKGFESITNREFFQIN